jgi:hypothetical protein
VNTLFACIYSHFLQRWQCRLASCSETCSKSDRLCSTRLDSRASSWWIHPTKGQTVYTCVALQAGLAKENISALRNQQYLSSQGTECSRDQYQGERVDSLSVGRRAEGDQRLWWSKYEARSSFAVGWTDAAPKRQLVDGRPCPRR